MQVSNMCGMIESYQRMYIITSDWNEHYKTPEASNQECHHIYDMAQLLEEAPNHNWNEEELKNERYHYDKVSTAYNAFKTALENALGINNNNN